MSFLSRFFSRSYNDVTDASIDRENVYIIAPEDSRLPVSEFTRQRLAEKAEAVRQRFGIVQEWGRGVARHAVGRGIISQFNTSDIEWNKAAASAVDHYLSTPSQCDLTGRRSGYEQQLWLADNLVIIGETFSAFVENPAFPSPREGVGGCPCFFNLAASDVRTPDAKKFDPKSNIFDGLEFGPQGQTLRFHCRTWAKEFIAYEAADMAHVFESHGAHQPRGITPFAPALNKLIDVAELQRLETRTAKAHRQVALILKGVVAKKGRGAFGKLQPSGDGNGEEGSTGADTAQMEKLYGGAGAAIARMGEDGAVELVSSNSPSPALNAFFNDMLLRDASAAIGLPLEFFWNPEKLGGANVRGIYARADAAFQQVADKIIYRFLEPLIVRFIRWRVASGLLAEPPGGIDGSWLDEMTYRRPRRVTVDNGRDSSARISDLDHGLANLRGLYDENGEDWLPQTQQWIDEFRIFKDECRIRGMSEDETTLLIARWRPAMPGSAAATPIIQAAQTGD